MSYDDSLRHVDMFHCTSISTSAALLTSENIVVSFTIHKKRECNHSHVLALPTTSHWYHNVALSAAPQ